MKKVKTPKEAGKKKLPKASAQKNDFSKNIRLFRWIKKTISGKSRKKSMDLLDQWILKKRALSLFY